MDYRSDEEDETEDEATCPSSNIFMLRSSKRVRKEETVDNDEVVVVGVVVTEAAVTPSLLVVLFPCRFPGCVEPLNSAALRIEHHMHVHWAQMAYPCGMCKLGFERQKNYWKHMEALHRSTADKQEQEDKIDSGLGTSSAGYVEPQRLWACGLCGLGFARHDQFGAHKRVMHPRAAEYRCSVCSKEFTTRNRLHAHLHKQHQIIVESDRAVPQLCPTCKKVYASPSTLQCHLAYGHCKGALAAIRKPRKKRNSCRGN